MKKTISLSAIILDPALQQRTRLDQELIEELAEGYKGQADIPPPHVFAPSGSKEYWLAAGFHRINAALLAELKGLEVEIHEGDWNEALLFACGSNRGHGSRPSQADKRRAVRSLLTNKRWKGKTSRWIGDVIGVSHDLVETIRKEMSTGENASAQDGETREGSDGRRHKPKPPKVKESDDDDPKAGEEKFDFRVHHDARLLLRKNWDRLYRLAGKVRSDRAIDQDKQWDAGTKILEAAQAAFEDRWLELIGTPFPKR